MEETIIRIPTGKNHPDKPYHIAGNHIRIIGDDHAVLTGTIPLSETDYVWQPLENGKFYTCIPMPDTTAVCGLVVNDKPYRMARYPKYDENCPIFHGYSADVLSPEKVSQWKNPRGGYIHAMHKHHWGGYSYRILWRNPDDTLAYKGGWQNNRQLGMHPAYRYVENIQEELTEPGEWFYNAETGEIYVLPCPGDDLSTAELAVLPTLITLDGCDHVTIENIHFTHTARTFMDTREPLLRSDWTIYRGGVVHLKNCTNVTISGCTFSHVGSNGIFVDGCCENILVEKCHLHHMGASGICFVGSPDSVRSPLFAYEQTQALAQTDPTPGPKSDNYPKHCTVRDCLIHTIGETEKQSAGVQISMAYGIRVENTSIYDTPRAGINISEGTFGGHHIVGCDVFDTVQETGDHGSFNSWGRDRFWHLQDVNDSDAGKYAFLDCVAPNIIEKSRFRCNRGWDIDLDDGSGNYIIRQNLCLSGGIKLREGFGRTVSENITVNNTLHLHVWYPNSGDRLENNILFKPYAPIGMPSVWGDTIDNNILHTPGQQTPIPAASLSAISSQDTHSTAMDCAFLEPDTGKYIPTHPQLTGWQDFPTVFGVRYAPLRALAKTPELPAILTAAAHVGTTASITKYGITVKNIETQGEMSAYGTAGLAGVLVMDVPENTDAFVRGIRKDDVIVRMGDTEIGTVADLPEELSTLPICVYRSQIEVFILSEKR